MFFAGLRMWRLRWCVLRGGELRCYVSPKDEGEASADTVLDLTRFHWVGPVARSLFEIEAVDGRGSPSTDIALNGPDGAAARIRATSPADAASWMSALQQHCASAGGDASPRSLRIASSPTLARAARIQDHVLHATTSLRPGAGREGDLARSQGWDEAQEGAGAGSGKRRGEEEVHTGGESDGSGAQPPSDADTSCEGWIRRQSHTGTCLPSPCSGLSAPLC